MSEELDKAENSNGKVTKRPYSGEVGQPHIVTSSRYIQDLRKTELAMPRRICTMQNMMYDDAVSNSVDVTNIQVVSALTKGEFVGKGSRRSKAAADFLNYAIRNITYGTWLEAINSAATDLIHGFSLQNIVLEKAKSGKYKGSYTIKKLSPRTQESLYGWVWDKHNRDLKGFVQKPMVQGQRNLSVPFESNISLSSINNGVYSDGKYPFISADQMLHFRHNPTDNNPQGNSPLINCFDAFTEKKLVEHYQIVAVSKDFGTGLLVIRVPSELIERANDPTKYPEEYKEYVSLQQDAANLQQGKSTHIVLTSDVDDISKKPLYDLELKGIDGGTGSYSSEEIINQKRKSIYNVFGTGFLLLGQNGHGSNSLAGTQMTNHDYYIQRCIDWKVDVITNQLASRLLSVNGVHLDWKDFPEFIPNDPSKPDLDTLGKLLQRGGSVELLTNNAVESIYKAAGWDSEGLDELLEKREQMKMESRAGESQGSSGTGDTQAGGGNSVTNTENKSLENFEVDYETDNQIVAVSTTTGEPMFIDKN